MTRRGFLLAAGALAAPLAVRAQRGVPRVGAIVYSATYKPIFDGLRAGLKELGLQEGRHLTLDLHDAGGEPKSIENAARRFEAEGVALIYSITTTATRLIKRSSSRVPVVFCVGTDPSHTGLVDSYARPGGRFTGVHYLTADLTAKRLELLKEALPKLSRVLTFYNPGNPTAQESSRNAREACGKLGLKLIERHVGSEAELRAGLDALRHGDADAYLILSDALVTGRAQLIIDRALAIRMPTIMYDQSLAERGALLSYGVDTHEVGRQSAQYVQRVLGGARPADLPVENVTRLIFAFNRRTAQAIGVKVPPAMLVRFDRVID